MLRRVTLLHEISQQGPLETQLDLVGTRHNINNKNNSNDNNDNNNSNNNNNNNNYYYYYYYYYYTTSGASRGCTTSTNL